MPSRDEITKFSRSIEKSADEKKIHCMDAILMHCEETGLEVEVAASLITSKLKSRIREEAQSINLLKKTSKLPI
jgi:tRNA(Leu) C34 or U34 (ribose-2'-O)-methylase TrmL